jgi:hypothetical protein
MAIVAVTRAAAVAWAAADSAVAQVVVVDAAVAVDAVKFHNRRAVQLENDLVRVSATIEGGHLAEILHKPSELNPLWIPPWPSIEPTTHDPAKHPEYGSGSEARLLSGILGHNICLDTFGGPSPEEASAGMPVHGEGPVIPYEVSTSNDQVTLAANLRLAQLRFSRRIKLMPGSPVVLLSETVENLSSSDRPLAWTQHVTLGPPFLQSGSTQFRMPATRSKVGDAGFNDNLGPYMPDAEFAWPLCPRKDGGLEDFRTYTKRPVSGGFTTHLMDQAQEQAFFLAWSPASNVLFGYVWKRKDFPWMARWEEHYLRTEPPWNGKTMTCGMEFGVSPFVESRRKMVERGTLFGVPAYRWAPARSKTNVEYCAFVTTAHKIPETVKWDGSFGITFCPGL